MKPFHILLPVRFTKIFSLSLILVLVFSKSSFSQCDSIPQNAPGLYPPPDSFPCIVTGQSFSETVHIVNMDTLSGVGVDWIRFDSILGLPSGIAAITLPDSLSNSEKGCINFYGTATDTGIYTISIYITMKVSILPNPISGELNALSQQFAGPDYSYYLYVIDPGSACPTHALTLLTSSTPAGCGVADGTASVSVSSGSGSYSYTWSPVGGTGATLTNLTPGTYYVTVTDDSTGSSSSTSITVAGTCGTISGHVFKDVNGNGVQDTGDNGLAGITININPGGYIGITQQNGDYSIGVGAYDTFSVEIAAPQRYYCSGTALLPDSVTAPATGIYYPVIISSSSPDTSGLDFGLANPATPCGRISGYVFDDVNGNGMDDGEPRKSGVLVQLSNGQSSVTDFYGMYSIEVPFNLSLTVSIVPTPASYFCGGSMSYFTQTFPPFFGTYTATVTSGSPHSTGNDFGVQQAGSSFDVGIYTIRSFSAVSKGTFTVWMDFKSNGTITDTCKLRLNFDPQVDFNSASLQPTTVTGTYIEWAFPPGTAPEWYCMEMEFFLSSSVGTGTDLVWTGTYTCGSPDGCPGNDTITVTQTVIFGNPRQSYSNGFNFMEVEHTGNTAGEITTTDSCFSYSIIFQNTGTDTAYHLTIVDTLSPYLNSESISRPFSSDAYTLCMPAPNIVIWEFNNINLPDSATDFHHSYGFVQYNIFMKPNLPPQTEIKQHAALSYNYSEPYITDDVSVQLKLPDAIKNLAEAEVNIYPNPGSGIFKIVLPENIGKKSIVKVYDAMGRIVMQKLPVEKPTAIELNLSEQAEGFYFVRIESQGTSWKGKVMLMK